jgi:thymidylate synthase (FAD)
MDRFVVTVLAQMPLPQTVIYAAMHQDYSEDWIGQEHFPDEEKCGEIVVKRLLAGERGHYGPLEHPQIVLSVGYFPHSVMQQARTHRIGISMDVQSMRYTGQRIVKAANGEIPLEDVFYLRPVGEYTDRFGKKYPYTESQRQQDLLWCQGAAERYKQSIQKGIAEEHARGLLPFDYRQHFVVSFNVRSLMHFLDLRAKKDAQLEIQKLCDLIWPHFQAWVPQIAEWYEKNRLGKAKLSP